MNQFIIRPWIPKGLFARVDGKPTPMEESIQSATIYAKKHNLDFGFVGGRVMFFFPSDFFGGSFKEHDAAVIAAVRLSERHNLRVAVMKVMGDEVLPLLTVPQ